mgnify:CR=1 FL=1
MHFEVILSLPHQIFLVTSFFFATRDEMAANKTSFLKREVCKVFIALPRFIQNQLGEVIIKSEDPDLCCSKKCVI